jgi:hypothetical protein
MSICLPAILVKYGEERIVLLSNPNKGSKVSSSFILKESIPTDVDVEELGTIPTPILIISDLEGDPTILPKSVLRFISEDILYPVPDSGVMST